MIGFAPSTDLGVLVDLDLVADDAPECMIDGCDFQAVMLGVIKAPCTCDQPLCLPHYDSEKWLWIPGMEIWCYRCRPLTQFNGGVFVRWEKI